LQTTSTIFALGLAASVCFAACAPAAFAQGQGARTPTPEELERSKTFVAPKVGDYAAKLASQPDLMGSWTYTAPPNAAGGATVFDPANAVGAFRFVQGEQGFGPPPGTYIKNIPFKPEWQKKYETLVKETTEGKSRDDFPACVPYIGPRVIGGAAGPMDIIQSPEVIIWHNTYSRDVRRIFLDGRPHPSPDGPDGTDGRTLTGHSVGRWEGDTLVVDTVNMLEGYYDETPVPFSNQLHMVERIRLIDNNTFEDQMTLTDPVEFERPWVVTRYFRRVDGPAGPGAPPGAAGPLGPNAKIVHSFLNLNDRPCVPNVVMVDGFQHMLLPQEIEAASPKTKAPAKAKRKITAAAKPSAKETTR
jgi:hypothetical protein